MLKQSGGDPRNGVHRQGRPNKKGKPVAPRSERETGNA